MKFIGIVFGIFFLGAAFAEGEGDKKKVVPEVMEAADVGAGGILDIKSELLLVPEVMEAANVGAGEQGTEAAKKMVAGHTKTEAADAAVGEQGTEAAQTEPMMRNMVKEEISPFNHDTECFDTDYEYNFEKKEIVEFCDEAYTCRPSTVGEEGVVVCKMNIEMKEEQSKPDDSSDYYYGYSIMALGRHKDSALAEEAARAILDYKFNKHTSGIGLNDPNVEVDIQCSVPSICYMHDPGDDDKEVREWYHYYSN